MKLVLLNNVLSKFEVQIPCEQTENPFDIRYEAICRTITKKRP